MADGDAENHTDGLPITSSSDGDREYSTDLQPMTAKGIKRLCSELLEIKKASDEDFHRNVYSCYSAFVRILEEVSQAKYDLEVLKHHVSKQGKLVQDLIDSFYLEKLSDNSETEIKVQVVEDLDLCSCSLSGSQVHDTLDTLDIFLSERQVDDALILLETLTKTLQRMQMEEQFSPMTTSFLCAISDRRAKIAKQFVLLAEHSRVAQPELQKALTGLCRLGEHHQANILLLNFYHLQLVNRMKQLMFRKPSLDRMFLFEVAKVIFSIISQGAKSFTLLYGDTYPYAPEFMEWARKEIEEFSHNFDAYLKSISEIDGRFSLAVEVVKFSFSLCSSLRTQKLFLLPDLMNFIRPYMKELLHNHVDQCRKVASILVDDETWVLNKFLLSRILEGMPSLSEDFGEEEYCLLTSSGRKLVKLMQELFGRLRELENVSRSIFQGKYGMAKKLLKELMEGIVVWLSNNQSFWKKTEDSLDIQKGSLLKQVHVDIHFLLEIARLGGYFSDNLMTAAMDIITEMDVKMTSSVSDLDCVLPDDRWVKDTVRLSIEELLNAELVKWQLKEEFPSVPMLEGTSVDSADQQHDVCDGSSPENFVMSLKSNSTELDVTKMENMASDSPDGKIFPVYFGDVEVSNLIHDAEGISFHPTDGEIELDPENKLVMLQSGIFISSTVEPDYISCCSSDEILKYESPTIEESQEDFKKE